MDEIEQYREGITRRGDRRVKNDRRQRRVWKDKKPKMFDAETILMFLALIGFCALMLYGK